MLLQTLPRIQFNNQFIGSAAVWLVTAGSAAFNAWGWAMVTTGFARIAWVSSAIGLEVLSVVLALAAEKAFKAGAHVMGVMMAALLIAIMCFNVNSGHRALMTAEALQRTPYLEALARHEAAERAYREASDEVTRVNGLIEAAPRVPENVNDVRRRGYQRSRNEELARLAPLASAAANQMEDARDDLNNAPEPAEPAEELGGAEIERMMILIEVVKGLALWMLGAGAGPKGFGMNAGQVLANRRWHPNKRAAPLLARVWSAVRG